MRKNRLGIVSASWLAKPLLFSIPKALYIDSIAIIPEAMEMNVTFGMSSYFAMTNYDTMTSVSGEKIPSVHPVEFAAMPVQQGRSIFVIAVLET